MTSRQSKNLRRDIERKRLENDRNIARTEESRLYGTKAINSFMDELIIPDDR